MKKVWLIVCCLLLTGIFTKGFAQSAEIEQLILNIEKLSQFKKVLQNLYDGYKVLEEGYNKVRNITSGNFQLHKLFLDGLYLVSPEVKRYAKVGLIIQYQLELVRNYKSAYSAFTKSKAFTAGELNYLAKVYSGLFDESLQNLDALLMVITDSKLRMSDDERLQRIDGIFTDMENKLSFLKVFNRNTNILGLQRVKENAELESLRKLYDQ